MVKPPSMTHLPLESKIEAAAIMQIKTRWPRSATRKMNGGGHRDWPDRLVLLNGVPLFFIEFKRPGQGPRPSQEFYFNVLKKLGVHIHVCHTVETAVAACETEIEAARD